MLTIVQLAALILATAPAVNGQVATPEPYVLADCQTEPLRPATPAADTSEGFPYGTMVTRETVSLAAQNVIACWNEAEWRNYVSLFTPEVLEETFGTGSAEQAAATLEGMQAEGWIAERQLRSVTDLELRGQESASAVVVWQEFQATHRQQWTFTRVAGDRWLVSGITLEDPEVTGLAIGLPITIDAAGIKSTRTSVVQTQVLALDLSNNVDFPVAVAVIASDQGAERAEVLDAISTRSAASGTVAMYIQLDAAESVSVPMENLAEGTWAIVVQPVSTNEKPEPLGALLLRVVPSSKTPVMGNDGA